jgi:ABC-type Fe3+-siderophore transport system permease subunit
MASATPTRARAALALCASLALLVLALTVGPQITRSGLSGDKARQVMWILHLPRAALGALAGVGLALSGTVLQGVLRNPLASPYTLGISSGASLGAVGAIQLGSLGGAAWAGGAPLTFLGALLGACLTAVFVYGVATTRELAAETLLLAGVAVALFCGAVITMLHYTASSLDLLAMVRWSMGGLDTVAWDRVLLVSPFVVVGSVIVLTVSRSLDVASLDDDSARGLGVDPVRVRRWAFVGTSLITAGVVAVAGPVGFVGLVVPHAVRALVGPDPRLLLPCAALTGGAFLVACDVVARTLLYPINLPINVITSAIGCPAFVWILVRKR